MSKTNKPKVESMKWRKSGKHLPSFMRDFHNQKDLFKCIHEMYGKAESNEQAKQMPDWISSQCYTIDWFLWFMAGHGYTLQKCRQNVEFLNIQNTVSSHAKERQEGFVKALQSHLAKTRENKP